MNKGAKGGPVWVWMSAGAVSISLIAVLGLLLLIAWRGLSYFWPANLYQWEIQGKDGQQHTVIGAIYDQESVPAAQLTAAGHAFSKDDGETVKRLLIKTGNREVDNTDFRWVLAPFIVSRSTPEALAVFQRRQYGDFYGYPVALVADGKRVSITNQIDAQQDAMLSQRIEYTLALLDKAKHIQLNDLTEMRRQLAELNAAKNTAAKHDVVISTSEQIAKLTQKYQVAEQTYLDLRAKAKQDKVIVQDMRGVEVTIPLDTVLTVTYPNRLNLLDKVQHWFSGIRHFISDSPRASNTEGGVFPAIFGTVFMVILMSVIVMPFGVIAAVYLHEYAKNNLMTKLIRISIINLAGVPSIVYGVFGLGFFVYFIGGSIDSLFYSDTLPMPTFGSPAIIWSALTLAILTLPIVIVSTEEGLTRVPISVRQGSLALGATKAETLWRVVLPMASPAMMTGLILAIARAAGEVAPLMLVGVVKLAPSLPLDMHFPYVHLDRQFMHLGFHIYDLGFQSPNIEATRPLVYATAFLLISVIVTLNLTAIGIRHHLRDKYRLLED